MVLGEHNSCRATNIAEYFMYYKYSKETPYLCIRQC